MKTLVLVDIENLCGKALPTSHEIKNAKIFIDRVAQVDMSNAFYVLGSHDGLRPLLAKIWPKTDRNGRLNRGGFSHSGKDGADRSIVHWWNLNQESLGDLEKLVLVSGDHFYLDSILKTLKKSIKIIQIARTEKSRHHLYREMKRITPYFLDEIIGLPLGSISQAKLGRQIDAWYDQKHKNYLIRKASIKSKSILESKTTIEQVDTKKNKVGGNHKSPNPSRAVSREGLSRTWAYALEVKTNGKRLKITGWERDHDWIFDFQVAYLSPKTLVTFGRKAVDEELEITLKDGTNVTLVKKIAN